MNAFQLHDTSPPRRAYTTVVVTILEEQRKSRPFFTRAVVSGLKGTSERLVGQCQVLVRVFVCATHDLFKL